uniref:Uncharacterized protein n=1 Tax=Panagrolaimus davidi TaxID=227884 RepID=A0A914Q3U6_9BILA
MKLYLKILRGIAATDFKVSDDYEEKGQLKLWNKSTSTFTTLNEDNNDLKNRWKNKNISNFLNITNKSTLSLHISAYENSNEAVALGLFDDENIEELKKEKLGSIKISKHCFTDRLMNPFEFPRQQNENQRNEPEIMPFNVSQRLLNPNQSMADVKISLEDLQILERMEKEEMEDLQLLKNMLEMLEIQANEAARLALEALEVLNS